ncbi:hypothetical protein [Xylocopilactobacillus apicola]|uniref:DUF4174 domain-containing protein n=1 Tax=Xylocopilactobacillus apicola TaxID=2932184 RepID=A0AAU9DY85_9LACO|nr:hypothetical protein [Xylocopilactobacillus apicola]BDR59118.1 hypothetical protein XA3_15590 [Xylocopilactobacillus apicola]
MSKTKGIILLFCTLLLIGCQAKKEDSTSSSVSVSKSSKSSSSKPEIEEISAEEYVKKVDNKDAAGQIIFFKTPGSKKSDEALKKLSRQCQEIGEKLYTVDGTTESGKKIIEKSQIIKTPYDAVILVEGGQPMYLDLPNQDTPTSVLKKIVKEVK